MKCPACGSECINNSCTVCGLENLNQIFMSKKDKEKWINDTVKPLKWKYNCEVMVGGNTFLCLTENKLWGWGGNNSKQLPSNNRAIIETPLLIAQDVISACAILNYVIYITQDGKLHYEGTDSCEIFKNIPKYILNEKFAKVYGDCKNNSIVLEFADKNRECLFLGYNDGCLIPRRELLRKDVTYPYERELSKTISGDYNEEYIAPNMDNIPEYRNMEIEYGAKNCSVCEIRDGWYYDGKKYKTVAITVTNRYIYDPVKIESEICTQYLWNGLPRVKDNSCQGSPYNEWLINLSYYEKCKILFKYTANDNLQVIKNDERFLQLNNIVSFAVNEDKVILMKNNGTILHGELKNFIMDGINKLEEINLDEFGKA